MGLSALVSINGKVVYNRALGTIEKLNFKYEQDTIYDLASLTKPLATSLLNGTAFSASLFIPER